MHEGQANRGKKEENGTEEDGVTHPGGHVPYSLLSTFALESPTSGNSSYDMTNVASAAWRRSACFDFIVGRRDVRVQDDPHSSVSLRSIVSILTLERGMYPPDRSSVCETYTSLAMTIIMRSAEAAHAKTAYLDVRALTLRCSPASSNVFLAREVMPTRSIDNEMTGILRAERPYEFTLTEVNSLIEVKGSDKEGFSVSFNQKEQGRDPFLPIIDWVPAERDDSLTSRFRLRTTFLVDEAKRVRAGRSATQIQIRVKIEGADSKGQDERRCKKLLHYIEEYRALRCARHRRRVLLIVVNGEEGVTA
ncbi:hypothetical protein R3P38DRAFT_3358287 [Favolaschia claudopus]|uniref:Uncharacterized protein n=1 Tax=Favolaschia claudopus TaxID=2862362 RepID=A0AAW0B5U3_9AGAR